MQEVPASKQMDNLPSLDSDLIEEMVRIYLPPYQPTSTQISTPVTTISSCGITSRSLSNPDGPIHSEMDMNGSLQRCGTFPATSEPCPVTTELPEEMVRKYLPPYQPTSTQISTPVTTISSCGITSRSLSNQDGPFHSGMDMNGSLQRCGTFPATSEPCPVTTELPEAEWNIPCLECLLKCDDNPTENDVPRTEDPRFGHVSHPCRHKSYEANSLSEPSSIYSPGRVSNAVTRTPIPISWDSPQDLNISVHAPSGFPSRNSPPGWSDTKCVPRGFPAPAESGGSSIADSIFTVTPQKPYQKLQSRKHHPSSSSQAQEATPDGAMSVRLFRFLLDELESPVSEEQRLLAWVDKARGLFRIVKKKEVADKWGRAKNNHSMTYEKFSRSLRYYYKIHQLERVRVRGRYLQYQFSPKAHPLVWKTIRASSASPPISSSSSTSTQSSASPAPSSLTGASWQTSSSMFSSSLLTAASSQTSSSMFSSSFLTAASSQTSSSMFSQSSM